MLKCGGSYEGVYLVDGTSAGRVAAGDNTLMIRISEGAGDGGGRIEPICIQISHQGQQAQAQQQGSGQGSQGLSQGPVPQGSAMSAGNNSQAKPDSSEVKEETVTVPPARPSSQLPLVNARRRTRARNRDRGDPPGYSTLPSNAAPAVPPPVPSVTEDPRPNVTRGRSLRLSEGPPRAVSRQLSAPMQLPTTMSPLPPVSHSVSNLASRVLGLFTRDKWCCCCLNQTVSIRWFILVIFLIGLCCTVTGTVLGATRFNSGAHSREHFTLSLLMIGVGVVLLTVSGIAWKMMTGSGVLDPSGSGTDCSAMLGLSGAESRFRSPNYYGVVRSHPYSGLMYPELLPPPPLPPLPPLPPHMHPPHLTQGHGHAGQFREPPPSYAASMQEYRLRLLLYERSNPTFVPNFYNPPPPYYYNQMVHHIHHGGGGGGGGGTRRYHQPQQPIVPYHPDYYSSRPPSYRSRNDVSEEVTEEVTPSGQISQPQLMQTTTPSGGHHHTRDPSVLSYLSHGNSDNISVVSEHTVNLQSPTGRSTVVTVLHSVNYDEIKDNVTIVQTNSESVNNSSSSSSSAAVIVTVSGQDTDTVDNLNYNNNNVQILAHL